MAKKAATKTVHSNPTAEEEVLTDTGTSEESETIKEVKSEETTDGPETIDMTQMSAAKFVEAYEGHVGALTDALWKSILEANEGGVFINRNIAASAFAEVMLRVCVAQAKSVEGGVERFKQILDL